MHRTLRKSKKLPTLISIGISALTIGATSLLSFTPVSAQAIIKNNRAEHFQAAAAEFGVPEAVLLGVSYHQTRWENHSDSPSVAGGYGLLHLTSDFSAVDQRGKPEKPLPEKRQPTKRTLDEAAALTGISPDSIKTNERQNIRAGAALLAKYARELNDSQLPNTVGDWYGAVANLSGATTEERAQEFADNVFASIQHGVTETTSDAQSLQLKAQSVNPDRSELAKLGLSTTRHSSSEAECPQGLDCRYIPARFAQNNPADPYDYGNYDQANRPEDMRIEYIVVHDTEGSYQSAIDWFQDPRSYTSAHYVIRSSDGEVTQMVKNDDVAWHAGNWYMNMHSIGIEHEGFSATGGTWYTEAMYRSSAELVRYLAKKYSIPLDRQHIVGHSQYLPVRPTQIATMHTDPGPFWDWGHYMRLLHAPVHPAAGHNSEVVTIAPRFDRNLQEVTGCQGAVCVPSGPQPANFVYLHTGPSHSAPLVTDVGIHPDGSPGTTSIEDPSARATHGQQFVVTERQGEWVAIWFGGQKAWLHNPHGIARTATPAKASTIKPKAGVSSITVYGRPVPEASAYPPAITPLAPAPMPYSISAGQRYALINTGLPTDYYHMWTFDGSGPGDGTIVIGQEKYLPISFHHRQVFVKASDVVIE